MTKISYSILVLLPLLKLKEGDIERTPVINTEELLMYRRKITELLNKRIEYIKFACEKSDITNFEQDYNLWINSILKENGIKEYSFRRNINLDYKRFREIIYSQVPKNIRDVLLSETAISSLGEVEKRKILKIK